jgi:hypothetical protein
MQSVHLMQTVQPVMSIFQIKPPTYIMFSEQPSHLLLDIFKKDPPTSLNVSGLHSLHQVDGLQLICYHLHFSIEYLGSYDFCMFTVRFCQFQNSVNAFNFEW